MPADSANTDTLLQSAQQRLNDGDARGAAAACKAIVEADPGFHRAHHMLGAIALRTGDAQAALEHLEAAAQHGNDHPMLPLHTGTALMALSRAEEAIAELKIAIAKNPTLAEAHLALANALSQAGYRNACIESYERATEIAPALSAAWLGWARTLLQLRRFEDAKDKLHHALTVEPHHVDALRLMARCDLALGNVLDARKGLERAHAADPDHVAAAEALAVVLSEAPSDAATLQQIRSIASKHDGSSIAMSALAAYLDRLRQTDDAADAAEKALALDPESSQAHLVLGRIADQRDRSTEAAEHFEHVLALEPSPSTRIAALKGLAFVRDAEGKHDEAFDAAHEANLINRELPPETDGRHDLPERIANYRDWIDAGIEGQWAHIETPATDRPDPIFFVGFPRSGTTLIETMLGGHPNLATAGEHAWLLMVMGTLGAHAPDAWADLDPTQVAALRRSYWSLVDEVHAPASPDCVVVDKMPLNIVDLPFAKRLFPNAKVLVALRDPRDCVLSAFMQNFRRTPELLALTDIAESGQFYADVIGLWLSWREHLGLDYLEVRYEDLVENEEAQIRRILEHLGQPWDDAVLDRKNAAPSRGERTPHDGEASKAVRSSAVGRWRHYEQQLTPALDALQPFIEAFGYADDQALPD